MLHHRRRAGVQGADATGGHPARPHPHRLQSAHHPGLCDLGLGFTFEGLANPESKILIFASSDAPRLSVIMRVWARAPVFCFPLLKHAGHAARYEACYLLLSCNLPMFAV